MQNFNYGTGVTGLLKRAWHQIPGVMGATVMGLIGLGLGTFVVYTKCSENLDPKYKMDYIVYRPDDPKVGKPVRE